MNLDNNIEQEQIELKIPVDLFKEELYYVISTNDESENLLCHPVCSQGYSLEDAEINFWLMHKAMFDYYKERSQQADRWVPFEKGAWGKMGGSWFRVFGIMVYFRYGKGMKGGWYVPFTKLNITISNYWTAYKTSKERK